MLKQLLIAGDDPDLVALVRSVALHLGTAPRYARHLHEALEGIGSTDLLVIGQKQGGASGEELLEGLLERGIELPPTLVFADADGGRESKAWGRSVMRRRTPRSEADARLALQFLLRASAALTGPAEQERNVQLRWVAATTDEQLHRELSEKASAEGVTLILARDREALSLALRASQPSVVLLDLAGPPTTVRDYCGVCNRELPADALVVELEPIAGALRPMKLGPRHWLAPRAAGVEAALQATSRPE